VQRFLRSGSDETLVTLPVSAKAHRQAKACGQVLTAKTLTLRLIRVMLSSGHIEVLATSLTDAETYPAWAFSELYRARWRLSEAFKILKHRLHVEQFSGELPESACAKTCLPKSLPRQPRRSLGPRSLRIVTRQ
ncbi:MAG: hypothetical protein ACREVA_06535, partial [Burkholderiales bacterium]